MIILDDQDQLNIPYDTAVTIGKFDGLHRGHRLLLDKVASCREEGLKSCFFTFDFSDFFDQARPNILTFDETAAYLRGCGIDYLVRMPVTKAFFDLSYRNFLERNLLHDLHMKKIICGDDFCFGHDRLGTPDVLKALSSELHYQVDVVPRIRDERGYISSTRIRKDLSEGDVKDAAVCLGRPYSITGTVQHGRKLAEEWGFPTANIVPDRTKLLPKYGVYAVSAQLDGRTFRGIANVGTKPTVTNENVPVLEVHLFDLKEDLYGCELKTEFISFVRPEIRFSDVSALIRQMKKDIRTVRTMQE